MPVDKQRAEANDPSLNRNKAKFYYAECTLNDKKIDPANLMYMTIREWIFDDARIPRLEIAIVDDGLFTDIDLPYEGKIIHIEAARDWTEDEESRVGTSIQADFKVVDFDFDKSVGQGIGHNSTIRISAVLHIPNITNTENIRYESASSFNVIKQLSNTLERSFKSNVSRTPDSMNWINPGKTNGKFLDHVTTRSFIEDGDAMIAFFDIDGNLNYNSIKTAITQDEILSAKMEPSFATEEKISKLKNMGKPKDIPKETMLSTLWYSTLNIKNAAQSNGVLNRGYSINDLHVDLGKHEYSFGNGNNLGTDNSPIIQEKSIDHYDGLITGSEDPRVISEEVHSINWSGLRPISAQQNMYSDEYFVSDLGRTNILSNLGGQNIIIEATPNIPCVNMQLVDLEVKSNLTNEPDAKSGSLTGKYLVCGIIYSIDNGFFKKFISLHRVGFNSSTITDESDKKEKDLSPRQSRKLKREKRRKAGAI